LRTLCLPDHLTDGELSRFAQVIARRRRLLRDDVLYRMGECAGTLYAVRFGHFKTVQLDRRGDLHVTGFQMAGELLAMDSLGTGMHASSAIALEDSEVCEIPYARLLELLPQMPRLLEQFHRLLGREIMREQAATLFLGNMRADQRLASFLLDLGERYAQRGYSSRSFLLRMSRDDIAGYLGLTLECISRQLARFRQNGWIALEKRAIELTDRAALVTLAAGLQPALGEPGLPQVHAA
jgi:CRP/FNR family transcriptional regulator